MALELSCPEPEKAISSKQGASTSTAENAGLSLRRLELARAALLARAGDHISYEADWPFA
jgi:hypothetical protein